MIKIKFNDLVFVLMVRSLTIQAKLLEFNNISIAQSYNIML